MPAATPIPVRRALFVRWQGGQTSPRIAAELGLPPRTVRHLVRRFRSRGEAGIAPGYRAPGPAADAVRDAALAMRREHPAWGGPLIRSRLLRAHPAAAVPTARTLQRWFARAGLGPPPRPERPAPAASRRRAVDPHDCWQMDAAEGLATAGGPACWLRVVDEATGAPLATRVFPPPPVGGRPPRGDRRRPARGVRPVGPAGPPAGR